MNTLFKSTNSFLVPINEDLSHPVRFSKHGEVAGELLKARFRLGHRFIRLLSAEYRCVPATLDLRILKLLKDEIIRLSDEGFTLLRMSELKQQLEMRLPDDPFTYEELKAVVGLLAGPGHVWQLASPLFQ